MIEDSQQHERTILGRKYFSQACQDLFVLEMLGNKKDGTFLEIGGAHPYESNNTFLLEQDFGWKGVSVEFDQELADKYNATRTNTCIHADATILDYPAVLKENFNLPRLDYLSADIDPAENTFKALLKIPHDDIRFSVITYEHDNYASGPEYMNKSREFLSDLGYVLVCANINCFGRDFEDWWIDPDAIPERVWQPFKSENREFSEIFNPDAMN